MRVTYCQFFAVRAIGTALFSSLGEIFAREKATRDDYCKRSILLCLVPLEKPQSGRGQKIPRTKT